MNGVLLGVFIYWGWDSGVAVNEESKDAANGPGKAAIVSTVLLLVIYLVVSTAAQAYGGAKLLDRQRRRRAQRPGRQGVRLAARQAADHRGADVGVRVDADDDPAHRASDAVDGAPGRVPQALRRHPSALPHAELLDAVDGHGVDHLVHRHRAAQPDNVLGDSVTALGFGIAFYYGITGFACAWYYRRELTKNVRTFVYAGVLPVFGGLLLFGLFIKSFIDYSKPANTNTSFLGVGSPVVIGVGALVLGVILLIPARFAYPAFFRRKTEVYDPHTAGQAVTPETAVVMAGSIVVGYDGGEGAEKALSEALTLARDLGATLVAVFGYEPQLAEREVKDYRDALHELGERHTGAAVEKAKAAGVEAVAEVIDAAGGRRRCCTRRTARRAHDRRRLPRRASAHRGHPRRDAAPAGAPLRAPRASRPLLNGAPAPAGRSALTAARPDAIPARATRCPFAAGADTTAACGNRPARPLDAGRWPA